MKVDTEQKRNLPCILNHSKERKHILSLTIIGEFHSRPQLNAFLEGFYEIIPKQLISIFNEQELELLISGLPNIDIDDLKQNTEYHKYQNNSLQIQVRTKLQLSQSQAVRAVARAPSSEVHSNTHM